MNFTLEWTDIALRLVLTVVAGTLLGLNRTEYGKPAGLRTTLLVSLAAAVAMIQANFLLATTGKAADSFVNMDPMRLPLGILTGMGFIGAGAILRKGTTIQGITTAATLWSATVIGLCFGGGQLALGVTSLTLAMIVLTVFTRVESRLSQVRRGRLTLWLKGEGPTDEDIRARLLAAKYEVVAWNMIFKIDGPEKHRTLCCEVRWQALQTDTQPPTVLDGLLSQPGVLKIRWSE